MHILFADDHGMVRDTLAQVLRSAGEDMAVTVAADLPEALRRAAAGEPLDLVLLDVDMPGMNGLEGLDRMLQCRPGVPVAILSGIADPGVALEALRRGARGYLPKTLGVKALLRAVQLVLEGEQYVPPLVLEAAERGEPMAAPAREALTAEEAHVLELLKQGFSNKQIARELAVEEYTVKYHLRGIFRKLGARNRTQAVTVALAENLP